ncbi:HlyD family secretion protein [Terriglobus saanensis]|nr:HlyD family secretion protein [Terriglobus saanensis]
MPVLLLGVLGLYLIFTHGQVSTDDAQVDGRLVPVSPKISGYISELLVDDNQIVHKGAVIARIDPRDAQVRVDQALAALKVAQAQAASSLSDVPLTAGVTGSAVAGAEANLADARAEYARARATSEKAHHADTSLISANVADRQANYERTRADLARMKDLADKHEISHLQYDRFVADELMAKSQLEAAQQSLASQGGTAQISDAIVQAAAARVQQAQAQLSAAHTNRGQVGMRSQDADAMQAAVLAAHANLDAAKLQVSYTEIIAPQEGKVTRRTVEAGAYVAPGQTLLTLVPTRDVWVTANFKETQLRNVHGGERVEVKVDQLGRTFSGHVASVSNATGSRLSLLPPENATGNFVKIVQRIPVKIALDPEAVSSNALSVGANVDVTIHTR